MLHNWYTASDRPGSVVRVLIVVCSKAFDLINYTILMEKLREFEIPASLIRCMASFSLNRTQTVQIGNVLRKDTRIMAYLKEHYLAQNFSIHINQLKTVCPLFKYVDDCTIFECLTKFKVSRIQLSLDELCA